MNGTRQEERTADGYLTIIDPARGVGLICEPLKIRPTTIRNARRNAYWRVISLYLRESKHETADFVTDCGRN